ncbi:STAS domain-containing protein [Sphaerisporangium sp. TRM90804]|uniref:STAS domain-containing protein n=1 Tax=Sphaerisporangium sp. TRM90804 TaxID=3031113 RepID=UPI0024490EC0|nr:STAS domain-containing protein [Sphaerisporangium sp. TRM90804]MDH2426872.1 STAS domain-containing protein [Sphaerisporangium sp. TRM90804]
MGGPDRASEFTVACARRKGAVVIMIGGELDRNAAPVLRAQLRQAWDLDPSALVVDVTAVTMCDSTGLSELITALQRCQHNETPLVLTGVQGMMQRVLTITGLRRAFDVYTSVDDALRELTGDLPRAVT